MININNEGMYSSKISKAIQHLISAKDSIKMAKIQINNSSSGTVVNAANSFFDGLLSRINNEISILQSTHNATVKAISSVHKNQMDTEKEEILEASKLTDEQKNSPEYLEYVNAINNEKNALFK